MKKCRLFPLLLALCMLLAAFYLPVSATAADDRLDLNTATAEELQELPGIGEVIAQRIIDYRELCGRFLDPEQLMEVDGIGQAKYEKLRELVTVRNTE